MHINLADFENCGGINTLEAGLYTTSIESAVEDTVEKFYH